ncbi:ATP-binding cassette domain-containing protein [Clostridium lacusfryxellense]|uniref:ATP-binding cassette domain-containing protein n=1 Tax=Clostridium lacusfryxellense TaxID=205328 RepID=UPI001C0D852F|nr:ATP-binding cassette domain-containing protein [Clostridium lacusfryxellense]MBU3111422.1 ATP-binding cassette domain-containing protein [Clostridium lacusfryxellense]
MIKINDLSFSYKNSGKHIKVLDKTCLTVKKGGICAIIGPSGGGKSTLLKVLAGIIVDYEGEVLIDGVKVNPKVHRIGFIPQNYGLVKWKTVEENIFLSTKIKDGKKKIDIAYYEKLVDKLKLKDFVKRYPGQLSGGQMQRVSIARALLLKPDLLLMDESFSSLDALTREEVQKLFLEVWQEHKVTTIIVTHDIKEAIYLAKNIAIISSCPGKVLEVIDNPLFGHINIEFDLESINMNKKLRKILKGEV